MHTSTRRMWTIHQHFITVGVAFDLIITCRLSISFINLTLMWVCWPLLIFSVHLLRNSSKRYVFDLNEDLLSWFSLPISKRIRMDLYFFSISNPCSRSREMSEPAKRDESSLKALILLFLVPEHDPILLGQFIHLSGEHLVQHPIVWIDSDISWLENGLSLSRSTRSVSISSRKVNWGAATSNCSHSLLKCARVAGFRIVVHAKSGPATPKPRRCGCPKVLNSYGSYRISSLCAFSSSNCCLFSRINSIALCIVICKRSHDF